MLSLKYLKKFFGDDFVCTKWSENKVDKLCEKAIAGEFKKDVNEELRNAVKRYAEAKPGQSAGNKYDLVHKLLE